MILPTGPCHLYPVPDMWILLHPLLGLSEVGRARGVVGRQALSEHGTEPRPNRPLRPQLIHRPRAAPSAAIIEEEGTETHTMEPLGQPQFRKSMTRFQDHPHVGVHLDHRDEDLEAEVPSVHHQSLRRSNSASPGQVVGRLTLDQPGTRVRSPAPLVSWHRLQTGPARRSVIQN